MMNYKYNDWVFLLVILVLFSIGQLNGQCDYLTNTYDVRIEKNISYGTVETFDGQMLELKMDIYKPVGDDNLKRPICIWVHGGGFSGGSRQDMRLFCQAMASKGIVAATISYRLGFVRPQGKNYPHTYDEHEILRVVYRDMQDTKGAIRFMKSRHLMDSTDVDRAFVGGGSAGGFIAMTAAYLNQDDDKPVSCGEISPITIGGSTYNRPDLGGIEGSLHLGEYNAKVIGVINIYGGLLDLEYVQPDEDIYAFLYHQTLDPVVPCGYDQPYWGTPSVNDKYPFVYGSCEILKRYDELKFDDKYIESIIHEGNSHGIHDIAAFYQKLGPFMNKAICDTTTLTKSLDIEVNKFKIYPNPAIDYVHIPLMDHGSIIDINGHAFNVISSKEKEYLKVDISLLSQGIYFIKGVLPSGKLATFKIIKL